MTYPQHWLFSWGGLLGDPPQEIWSNSIRFASTLPGGIIGEVQGDDDLVLSTLKGKIAAKFPLTPAGGGLGYSLQTLFTWAKFNQIGPDGKYVSESVSNTSEQTPGVRGSGSSPGALPQAALAVSWQTAVNRGLASKGRIYIPMPGVTVDAVTWRVSSSTLNSLAINWANLISDMANLPGVDLSVLKPCVVSGVREGAVHPITGVRIGGVAAVVSTRRTRFSRSPARKCELAQLAPIVGGAPLCAGGSPAGTGPTPRR